MSIGEIEIKRNLESIYDIPFYVQSYIRGHEPCYIIGPLNEHKELFQIIVQFKDRIRINMELLPEKYGAHFIRSIGYAPEEKKYLFCTYAKLFRQRGAKITFNVNGSSVDPFEYIEWPKQWENIILKVTRVPISENGDIDYIKIINNWGTLMMGMILSLADIVSKDNDDFFIGKAEGAKNTFYVNRYERNPINRKICLEFNGYTCNVCGFNFEKFYGELGKEFIHVHHTTPVSQMGDNYIVDPVKELVPVCPNCHAMLHRQDPPLTIEQLRNIILQHRQY